MTYQFKNGGPAFPIPIAGCKDGNVYNTLQQSSGELGGMTLRDYFAIKAMAALIVARGEEAQGRGWPTYAEVDAYKIADAMLRAREV